MRKAAFAFALSSFAVSLGAVLILDAIDEARVRSRLQEVADNAAVSGVLVLASNTERGPTVARQEATVAARNSIPDRFDAAWSTVEPGDDLTLSVHIAAPQQSRVLGFLQADRPVEVIGNARYLPPAQHQETHASASRLKPARKYAQSRD